MKGVYETARISYISMLKNPEILFFSCLGSYFYSILQYLENDNSLNSLLYYLVESQFKYIKQDIRKIQGKNGDNPWRYQPITVIDTYGDEIEINDAFFHYIKNEYNIDVEKVEMSNSRSLIETIRKNEELGIFSICKVDEFYIKHCERFYLKKNNRHYLLIRSIDIQKAEFEVIDSEINTIYKVGFDELERAFYENNFTHKVYYRVNCLEYVSKVDSLKYKNVYEHMQFSMEFLSEMIEEMNAIQDNDKAYCFNGYRYNILSKIIPVVELRRLVFNDSDDEFRRNTASELSTMWKNLNVFMSYKITRKNFDFRPVQEKLILILKKETEFNKMLKEINGQKISF